MRFRYSLRKMAEVFANSEDPDQMLHSAASDLGLQCLPITRLGVSQLQWVKDVNSCESFCVVSLRTSLSWNFTA